jgi:hypothetical protein
MPAMISHIFTKRSVDPIIIGTYKRRYNIALDPVVQSIINPRRTGVLVAV